MYLLLPPADGASCSDMRDDAWTSLEGQGAGMSKAKPEGENSQWKHSSSYNTFHKKRPAPSQPKRRSFEELKARGAMMSKQKSKKKAEAEAAKATAEHNAWKTHSTHDYFKLQNPDWHRLGGGASGPRRPPPSGQQQQH